MIRAYHDNVIIVLEPLPTETASGIAIVHKLTGARDSRIGRVIASGPGHYKTRRMKGGATLQDWTEEVPVFVPNQTRPGDRVVVDALAGQNYDLDFTVPRHNKEQVYQTLGGERGHFRIVREHEILGILESDEAQAAE